jgi:TfoX/Sxy family transcriptional regulator of competence genes
MAFDEGLAERVRQVVAGRPDIDEKKMFGGLCLLSRGLMFAGILGDTLMARIGPENHAEALARPHVRPMDFTGRPMKGYVYVDPEGIASDDDLKEWIDRCLAFVATLPPKQ